MPKILELNKQNIFNTINSVISSSINETMQKEVLDYYTRMTLEQKKQKLNKYKIKFGEYLNGFKNHQRSVEYYFDAYEFILQFRKFILGELGNINYSFVWSVKEREKSGKVITRTVTIGSEKFIELLKDSNGKIVGLQDSNGNLRFNNVILNKLKAEIKAIQKQGLDININQNYSSFSLVNEVLGTKQDFADGKLFKAKINALQKNRAEVRWYIFNMEVSKDISKKEEKAVFKYNIKNVEDKKSESSSIFSAIGKYFADQMETKTRLVKENFDINIDPSYPNVGNLTEMYIVAKARLNKGHNTFKERTRVPGKTLFEIYNEIKANTEPFYSGGDYLMNQIKSFLGSNPSLSSFATIENTVKSFYEALDTKDYYKMKKDLSQLLLQKPSTSKLITEEEKKMSQNILEAFIQFFSDLI